MNGNKATWLWVGCTLLIVLCVAPAFAQQKPTIDIPDEVKTAVSQLAKPRTDVRLPPSMTYDPNENNWLAEKIKAVSKFANIGSRNTSAPFVMLAGYYDTDVTYQDGGTFKFIAYVWDPDGYSDIGNVEIYYASTPTSVYLADDGNNGDFGAGDSIFGISVPIPPLTLPSDRYLLEIVATDLEGNQSDMWPYLTIHP